MKNFLTVMTLTLLGFTACAADQTAATLQKGKNYSPDPRLLVHRLLGTFFLDVNLGEAFKNENAKSVTLTLVVKTQNGEFRTHKTYERGDVQSEPIIFEIPDEDQDLVTLGFSVAFGFSGDVTSYSLAELFPPTKTENPRQN